MFCFISYICFDLDRNQQYFVKPIEKDEIVGGSMLVRQTAKLRFRRIEVDKFLSSPVYNDAGIPAETGVESAVPS